MALSTEEQIKASYRDTSVAADYVKVRFTSELHRLLHDRQVAAVQRVIDRAQPASLLEIAPGPGRLTRDVRPRGSLVCLEYNDGMIAEGRRACAPAVTWIRGNAFDLPFTDAFDLVYSFRFVRHFHRADRERFYAEVRRVLRPGGHLVFDAVNERLSRPHRDAHPDEYPIYDKLYGQEELRKELESAGFTVLQLEPVQKNYRWQLRSQVLLSPRVNWLNRMIIRGLERLPSPDGLEWIVTCRRA